MRKYRYCIKIGKLFILRHHIKQVCRAAAPMSENIHRRIFYFGISDFSSVYKLFKHCRKKHYKRNKRNIQCLRYVGRLYSEFILPKKSYPVIKTASDYIITVYAVFNFGFLLFFIPDVFHGKFLLDVFVYGFCIFYNINSAPLLSDANLYCNILYQKNKYNGSIFPETYVNI